ncbi:MAG: TonB family protein [Proteobacteria bacterium]|nr:TonB family protein [Pseudomonadota bacterium]
MSVLARLPLWPRAATLALALHLGAGGASLGLGWMGASSALDYGAEEAIEFAPIVASAESEFQPDAAASDAEDRLAAPKVEEVKSEKQASDTPTEASSVVEAEEDLRMAKERTRNEVEKAEMEKQATEAMQQQEASTSSQAATAADSTPDQAGPSEDVARAPEAGNSLEAKRRMEEWQKKLFAHVVKFKRYPHEARGRRLSGEAQVSFALDAQGGVSALKLARSSGHGVLDAAALDWMTRASPLPAPPPQAVGREFALPMKFAVQ